MKRSSVAIIAGLSLSLANLACQSHEGQKPVDAVGGDEVGTNMVLDVGHGATIHYVYIHTGKFLMGSPDNEAGRNKYFPEGPQHEVTISKAFYLSVCEITRGQYQAVMGTMPDQGFVGIVEEADQPIQLVSWNDAVEFCRRVSEKTGLTVRLPTEAEWEYACRAGSQTRFFFGDKEGNLEEYAWYEKNSGKLAHSVGQKKPNAWGLYDMCGNAWEWCSDWYFESYPAEKAIDPVGPLSGTYRVVRGGSKIDSASSCRSAARFNDTPDARHVAVGFRVAVNAK